MQDSVTLTSPSKTDWSFVITLLSIGALCWFMVFTGMYIDKQAKRIDKLELEMESVMGVVSPLEKPKAGVTWHDKQK